MYAAQCLRGRASCSRLQEPGFESCAAIHGSPYFPNFPEKRHKAALEGKIYNWEWYNKTYGVTAKREHWKRKSLLKGKLIRRDERIDVGSAQYICTP